MKSRWWLGFIEVKMWGYRWGWTAAQVELMTVDLPFVAYKKRDDDDGKNGVKSEQYYINAVERWKERRRKRGYDLKHFVLTGEKVPLKEK